MMCIRSKQEYARELGVRYRKASRPEKSRMLDEFVATCGYNRKYAVTLLRNPPEVRQGPIRRPRARHYGEEVQRVLVQLWEASDRLCGKRLVPFMEEMVTALERSGELNVPVSTRERLLRMSVATADRLLAPARRQLGWRGKTTTKPGTLLRHQIAVRTGTEWEEDAPGYFEADLVAHCGGSTHGEYLNSLVLTDIATGWTETESLPNRSQNSVTCAVDRIRKRLPFAMIGLDSDNGGEFINAVLYRYCQENRIQFTRCRPYKKNDQCHVEQKNWSVVRQRIGYARYEGAQECRRLAVVYSWLRPFVNFFQPSLKLIRKKRDGARMKKEFDRAQTPYQRLLSYGILTHEEEVELREYYEQLNPRQLMTEYRVAIERLNQTARVRISGEATIAA